jgi:hypothetical protein
MGQISGAQAGLARNDKLAPRSQERRPPFKIPQAKRGAREILNDGHRLAELRLEVSNALDHPGVLLVSAMGKVQAGDIHSGEDQTLQDLF